MEEDLECVKGLIGLQTITSLQEYDGSKQLFLFEQLTHLDRCGPSCLCPPLMQHASASARLLWAFYLRQPEYENLQAGLPAGRACPY